MTPNNVNVGIRYGGSAAFRKRIANGFLIGFPLLGSLYALFYFSHHRVLPFAVLQMVLWYVVTALGVGVGFHRYFTHRSFQTTPVMRLLFGVAGSFTFQGSVIRWIADHRRHHRFSDEPPDVHTPHRYPILHRVWSRMRNLWHGHVGWMFDDSSTVVEIYAPDLLRDPIARWLDRWYPCVLCVSLLLPYLCGLFYGGYEVAFQSLLLGGFVRITLLHNVTWAINSIGHTWGTRPSTINDESRNNWFLAVLTFGEGWHNNHHAAPRCAYNNWRGHELDFSGALIRILERLGAVWAVVTKHGFVTTEFRAAAASSTPPPSISFYAERHQHQTFGSSRGGCRCRSAEQSDATLSLQLAIA